MAKNPSADLRVYAVWTNKLLNDSRSQWDTAGLTDRRVSHFWDQADVTGDYFANSVTGYDGGTWDAFLAFGPSAQWADSPSPLLASGSSVIGRRDQLKRALARCLLARPLSLL
jgi:hypothetical protein